MNSIELIGAGRSQEKRYEELKRDPKFRRATRNMLLAYSAIETLLVDELGIASKGAHHIGMVLGTGFGEFTSTASFLETWGRNQIGRPVLFQNSLHNATVGFLSLTFQITGPCLTVSQGPFSGEKAIELAMTMLHSKSCDFCLAVGADDQESPYLQEMPSPTSVRKINYGAGALLLTTCDGAKSLPRKFHLGTLANLKMVNQGSSAWVDHEWKDPVPSYDSDMIEHVTRSLSSISHQSVLTSVKRDRSYSQIQFRKRNE